MPKTTIKIAAHFPIELAEWVSAQAGVDGAKSSVVVEAVRKARHQALLKEKRREAAQSVTK